MKITRSQQSQLQSSLQIFPVVGLVGPRQVGKTSLARTLAAQLRAAAVMLDLERPSDVAKLVEPELFLEPLADKLVILDEVQLRPDLFPVLRSLEDAQRRPGRCAGARRLSAATWSATFPSWASACPAPPCAAFG